VGNVCCIKLFTIGSEKFSQWHSKVTDDAQPGVEVAETTVKRLLCCRFRCTGKVMGQGYPCWWRICREINVFLSRLKYHIFYILCPFVTYLLTLPHRIYWITSSWQNEHHWAS
jgi:hypothetical protein